MRIKTSIAAATLTVLAWFPGVVSAQADPEVYACSAEAAWINCWEGLGVESGTASTVTLHLRSHVGEGSCLPARVALTAAYLDRQGEVLCVGTHDDLATLNRNVQDVAIEINPLVLRNFTRWRNRPNQRMDPMFEPLECAAPGGRSNLLDNHLESAVAVEVAATLLPQRGGLSVAECRLSIAR